MNAHQRRIFRRCVQRAAFLTVRTDPHFGINTCDAVIVQGGKAFVIRRTKSQPSLYSGDYVGGFAFSDISSMEREVHEETHRRK